MSANKEVQRLVAEMKFAFEGDEKGESRFQPALWPLLVNVDAKHALHRPIPEAHNIWELVLHLITWKKYITARFRGEAPTVTDEQDWPALENPTEESWNALKHELLRTQNELVEAAQMQTDAELDIPAVNGKLPRYVIYHGITQHDLYHGGQIAMLKKATL